MPQKGLSHWFSRFAARAANATGSHWAFIITGVLIIVWFLSGPLFGFSDTWQLIANTVTTLTTALMVFLIQNTQNRDARAIHLKLDELLRATPKARNEFMEAEEEDLDEIEREKAIVDQDDPAPPEERAHGHTVTSGHRGNGKTSANSIAKCWETELMADQTNRDSAAERVAETVRRALSLVGPSEHGVERLADKEPAEEPGV